MAITTVTATRRTIRTARIANPEVISSRRQWVWSGMIQHLEGVGKGDANLLIDVILQLEHCPLLIRKNIKEQLAKLFREQCGQFMRILVEQIRKTPEFTGPIERAPDESGNLGYPLAAPMACLAWLLIATEAAHQFGLEIYTGPEAAVVPLVEKFIRAAQIVGLGELALPRVEW